MSDVLRSSAFKLEMVKGNGISKKLPQKKYLKRERNSRDEPTAFTNILSHIVGIYINDNENQPKPIIFIKFSTLLCLQNYIN